jgi:poly(beta-D-mannuronate) lyase
MQNTLKINHAGTMKNYIVLIFFVLFMTPLKAELINPFSETDLNLGVGVRGSESDQKTLWASTECPYDLLKPVTQDLIIGSKYDQSDATKSTLISGPIEGSEINEAIKRFSGTIVKFSDYAILARSPEKRITAIKCMQDNLKNWAKAGAMVDVEASKQGQAVRKWFLASISSSILKVQAAYPQVKVPGEIRYWIKSMGFEVFRYYDERFKSQTKWFNNHDHWAAFSVGLAAIIGQDPEHMDWVKRVFDYSLSLAKTESNTGGLYFDNEVGRGQLGAEYMNFSMVPLVFMADYLRVNDMLSYDAWKKVQLLAQFTRDITLHPERLSLDLPTQKAVASHRMVWLLPYRRLVKKLGAMNYDAETLLSEVNTSGSASVGGTIEPFYR